MTKYNVNDLRIGFNVYDEPVESFFDYAIHNGIKHLEIDLIQKHSVIDSFNEDRISKLKAFTETHGVDLSLHAPYTLDLAERRSKTRKKAVEYLEKCVVLASQINAKHITTHLGCFYGWPIWPSMREKAVERLILSLKEVLDLFEKYGVTLAMENVMRLPMGGCFSLLGDNMSDFKTIFSSIDSKYLKLCLDLGHAHMCEGVMAYIGAFPNKISGIHFHDNKGEYDDHLSVGEGTIPWRQAVTALNAIPFHGPYISECRDIKPHESIQLFRTCLA